MKRQVENVVCAFRSEVYVAFIWCCISFHHDHRKYVAYIEAFEHLLTLLFSEGSKLYGAQDLSAIW